MDKVLLIVVLLITVLSSDSKFITFESEGVYSLIKKDDSDCDNKKTC